MMNEHTLLRFGRCEVDPSRHEVRRDGQLQAVAPKALSLLVHLLKERHRVVTKRELLTLIWRSLDVSDNVLARAVMDARRAIGDSPGPAARIRTIHGHGYRFVGDVFESSASPHGAAKGLRHATSERLRLGVLPCRNQTGDAAWDWTQHGLMMLVEQALQADPRIEVVPLLTMLETINGLPLRAEAADRIKHALVTLDLGWVVHTSIRRQGQVLWLDYQLAAAGQPSVSGSLQETDAVQSAERLARAVHAHLLPGEGVQVMFESRDPFVNQAFARAMELYVQSRFDSAVRLMAAVELMEPQCMSAGLWHLHLRVLAGDAAARRDLEAMLVRAREAGDTGLQAVTHQIICFAIGREEGPVEAACAHLDAGWGLAADHAGRGDCRPYRIGTSAGDVVRGLADSASDTSRRVAAAIRTRGNPLDLPTVEYSLAQLAVQTGDLAAAQQGFEYALTKLRLARREALALQALVRLAEVHAALGLFRLAEDQCNEALDAIQRIPNPHIAAFVAGRAAGVLATRGGALEVDRVIERTQALNQHMQPGIRGPLAVAQGWRDFLRGDRVGLRRRAQSLAADVHVHRAKVHTLLALWLRAEDLAQEMSTIEQARGFISQYVERGGAPTLRGWCLLSRATQSVVHGKADEALACLSALVADQPLAPLHSVARLNASWLHLERGDLSEARRSMDEAGAWTTEHPAGLAVQARWAWASGEAAQAASLQRRAMLTFRGPVAPWHQAQLDAYLTQDVSVRWPSIPWPITDSFAPATR